MKNQIVQFMHPGGEHLVNIPRGTKAKVGVVTRKSSYSFKVNEVIKKGWMPWNDASQHRRKFVQIGGKYIEKIGNKEQLVEGEIITCWTEWESSSTVEKIEYEEKNDRVDGYHLPKYIHKPVFCPLGSSCF